MSSVGPGTTRSPPAPLIANAPSLTCTGIKLVARGGKDVDTISGSSGVDRLFGNKA